MTGVEKKGFISEEDVSLLLQRYSATTILALLQEVSQFAGVKIDWKTLVKRTSTGISSAREYQMLWRHLAYRGAVLEKLEDGAEPLDDDSDLEFEVEAVPAVSGEASSEAAACVKVLISSGSQRDSCPMNRSTVEAPLTINVPNDQASCVPSEKQQMARCTRGTNITVPVSVQKQTLHTGPSAEVLDENGSAGSGLPAKKKRKLWTKEEDQELIAAVEKCGEGNWANILKGDFKHDRTASQLSQRWAIIRKRQANLNPGGVSKSSGSTRSEERLAAQKAITLFIDMPMSRSISAISSGAAQSSTSASSSIFTAPSSEAPPVSAPQALAQNQQPSEQATPQKGAPNPSNKPRTTQKKPPVPVMPPACLNSSIQAAAFAAGGRIAAPSTAASLFKAAQSKSAVHIRPVGGALPPKSLPTTNTAPVPNLGAQVPRQVRPAVMPPPPVNSGMAPPRLVRPANSSATSCALESSHSTQSETKLETLGCTASQENAESKTGIIVSAVDVDDLLEEIEGSDNMELDGVVAPDWQTGLPSLDLDENGNHVVDNVGNAGATVDGQVDLSKSEVSSRRELVDMGATENQAMLIDAGGTQITAENGIRLSNGASSDSQGVDGVTKLKQDVAEEKVDSMEASSDEIESQSTTMDHSG